MPLTPQRAKNGLNTSARPNDLFGDYQAPGPVDFYQYKNDFSTYLASDWTVASINAGTSALANGNGGLLVQTTGTTSTNYQANQLAATSFAFTPGYRTWFWGNFKLSDVATANLFTFGLVDTLAAMAVPGNGVYFNKPLASATVSLILNKAGTLTTVAIGTMVINTAHTLGVYYDGKAVPTLYAYSSIGSTVPTAFGPDPVFGGARVAGFGANSANALTNLPAAATGLTLGWGVQTGAASAKTCTCDYIGAAMQVARV